MDRVARIEKVACEVFSQVRTSIVLKMRFMDLAVFKLMPAPSQLRLATDGSFLYYQPSWVACLYKARLHPAKVQSFLQNLSIWQRIIKPWIA